MAPLFVLIGTTGVVFVISAAAARSLHGHWTTALRAGLAGMFAMTGTTHFVGFRDDFVAMVPPALPAPELLVTATGVLQLAGAVGLLWRPTARWSAAGLTGLLVAMFPANVYAALSGTGLNGAPPTPLGVRTVIQLVFIAAAVAVWVALGRDRRRRRSAQEPGVRSRRDGEGDAVHGGLVAVALGVLVRLGHRGSSLDSSVDDGAGSRPSAAMRTTTLPRLPPEST